MSNKIILDYVLYWNGWPFQNFNPFPNKPWFLRVYRTTFLKTRREKEKLLVMSNFSFSHSVFYPFVERFAISTKFKIVVCKLFQIGRVRNLSFGNGLNLALVESKVLHEWQRYHEVLTFF